MAAGAGAYLHGGRQHAAALEAVHCTARGVAVHEAQLAVLHKQQRKHGNCDKTALPRVCMCGMGIHAADHTSSINHPLCFLYGRRATA